MKKTRYDLSKYVDLDVYKSQQTREIMRYIENKYQDKLEFLWLNSPNSVYRHQENDKWYAVLLVIPRKKIGLPGEGKIEIINLKHPKEKTQVVVDNKTIFPGFHMNKNNWITIPLDDRLKTKKIFAYIDLSYTLSGQLVKKTVGKESRKISSYKRGEQKRIAYFAR